MDKELLAKANAGDDSAMFKLGVACSEEGNHKGAVEWWDMSAEEGNRNAAINLVFYHRNNAVGMANKQRFLYWLKKLAYYFKDGWGQVLLGIIYCGTRGHTVAFFGADSFVSELNPEEGLRLLNEGVPLAEEKGNPELTWVDYSDISASYSRYRINAYEGKEGFSKGKERQNLEKELLYLRKSHEAHLGTTFAPERREFAQKKNEYDLKRIDILEQELDGSIDIVTSHQKWVKATNEFHSALGHN